MCLYCDDTGLTSVCIEGMDDIGGGWFACRCVAGRKVLTTARAKLAARRAATLLGDAGIPAKFQEATLESFHAKVSNAKRVDADKVQAWRRVSEWVCRPPPQPSPVGTGEGAGARKPWLYLHGETGRGKTGLGIGALKVLVGQGVPGKFISSFDMFDEMKQRFGGNVEEYTQALVNIPVLMIDELHPILLGDWRVSVLFTLLYARDAKRLTTILTSAATETEIEKAVTVAGMRRIAENSLMLKLKGNPLEFGQ